MLMFRDIIRILSLFDKYPLASGSVILNKKVWAIKYCQYFFCIGTGMAYTFAKKY